MTNYRIGDIELRKSKSLISQNEYWEIVKWYPNPYYEKEDEWEEISPNYFQNKKDSHRYVIGKAAFDPQSCYTIYFIIENGDMPSLKSVENRPYVLEKEDKECLEQIIKYLYENY